MGYNEAGESLTTVAKDVCYNRVSCTTNPLNGLLAGLPQFHRGSVFMGSSNSYLNVSMKMEVTGAIGNIKKGSYCEVKNI